MESVKDFEKATTEEIKEEIERLSTMCMDCFFTTGCRRRQASDCSISKQRKNLETLFAKRYSSEK